MRRTPHAIIILTSALLAVSAEAAGPPGAPLTKCPVDSVISGSGCMDRYEASVWRVPNPATTHKALVKKIQQGKATVALLTAGGAKLLGTTTDDYAPCALGGENCDDIFAVSLPGVMPSSSINWFQAQQACANAGKRLPSNAEWQAAVAGSPDPGPDNGKTDCNTDSGVKVLTGSRSACLSSVGAFDMVGNVSEWVADWVPRSDGCGIWSAGISPTIDLQCLSGAKNDGEPGALLRGGYFLTEASTGPFTIDATNLPSLSDPFVHESFGFRCTR